MNNTCYHTNRNLKKKELNSIYKSKHIFTAFTHISCNYFTINHIKCISEIATKDDFVHFLFWDINFLIHELAPYYISRYNSEKNAVDAKIAEIYAMASSYGLENNRFRVYKASDSWDRFNKLNNQYLFLELYKTIHNIDIKDAIFDMKGIHFIQIPLEFFFAEFFHKLYPEFLLDKINLFVCTEAKRKIIDKTKEGMKHLRTPIISDIKILNTEGLPFITYNSEIPNWDHDFQNIYNIILNTSSKEKEIIKIFDTVLFSDITNFKILKNDSVNIFSKSTFFNKLLNLDRKSFSLSVALNIYELLQSIKGRSQFIDCTTDILSPNNRKSVQNIGKILKSEIYLEVIHLANGEFSVSQIAKKLHKHISNISSIVHELHDLGIIEINNKHKIFLKTKSININLEFNIENKKI